MLQQMKHIVLHRFQLLELQVWVRNLEQVTTFWVFVNEHALAIAGELGFDFEDALAFEHGGEDVPGRGVSGIVFLEELAQKCFGSFFLDGVGRRGWRWLKLGDPMRDELGCILLSTTFFPAALTEVLALVTDLGFGQKGVKLLVVHERFLTLLTGARARLDVPFHSKKGRAQRRPAIERYYRDNLGAAQMKLASDAGRMGRNGSVVESEHAGGMLGRCGIARTYAGVSTF